MSDHHWLPIDPDNDLPCEHCHEFGVRVGDHVDPHDSMDAALVTWARDGGELVVRARVGRVA